jgi:predicted Zn finger-like uncharacterized protein
MLRTVLFKCPNCGAVYQVVKAEAGPETSDGPVACRICGAPLAGRDGPFVPQIFSFADPWAAPQRLTPRHEPRLPDASLAPTATMLRVALTLEGVECRPK